VNRGIGPIDSRSGRAMETDPNKPKPGPKKPTLQRGLGQALPLDQQDRPIGPRGPGGPNRLGSGTPTPQGSVVPIDQPR
jgi:hypothetical protein